MARDDVLFAEGHLSDALRGQERKMARSTEELAADLVERFQVAPLDRTGTPRPSRTATPRSTSPTTRCASSMPARVLFTFRALVSPTTSPSRARPTCSSSGLRR